MNDTAEANEPQHRMDEAVVSRWGGMTEEKASLSRDGKEAWDQAVWAPAEEGASTQGASPDRSP